MDSIIRLVYPGSKMEPRYKDIVNFVGKMPITEAKKTLLKKHPEALFCLIGKNLNIPIILQEGQNIGREEWRISWGIPITQKYLFISAQGVAVFHNYGRMINWSYLKCGQWISWSHFFYFMSIYLLKFTCKLL